MTFVECYKKGYALPEDIHIFIEYWHSDSGDVTLPAFLGITPEEYALWIENRTTIKDILANYK